MIWNMYPYTDFHNMNQDWIIRILKDMEKKLEDFVATNSIKYANPFQWNITSQYEKNTLTIDAQSGIAYLSVQAVPSGVAITNTSYWTPVFDLGQLFIDFNKNFTGNDEQLNIVASTNYSIGDWIIWKNLLYEVIATITAGDLLNEGVNLDRIAVENVIDILKSDIQAVANSIDTKISNQVDKEHIFNVRDFGALGDDLTDDTQAFIDAINAAGTDGAIFIPVGKYHITGIEIDHPVSIIGTGQASMLIPTDNTKPAIEYKNITLNLLSIKDIAIYRQVKANSAESDACGIKFDGCNGQAVTIENVHLYNHYTSLNLDGAVNGWINNCFCLEQYNNGIQINGSGWVVNGCYVQGTDLGSGYYIATDTGIGGMYFNTCTAYRCKGSGFMFENQTPSHGIYDVILNGCVAGSTATGGFVFVGGGGNHILKGCYSEYAGYETENMTVPNFNSHGAISIDKCSNCIIDDALIFESCTSGVRLYDSEKIKIADSSIRINGREGAGHDYPAITVYKTEELEVNNCYLDGGNIQAYSLLIDGAYGTVDDIAISNCDVRDNRVSSIIINAATNVKIDKCKGYVPSITTPAIVSAQEFINDNPCKVRIYTSIASVSAIVVKKANGSTTSVYPTVNTFELSPSDSITITYTGAAYWTWSEA